MVLLFLAIIGIGYVIKVCLEDAENKRIVKDIKEEHMRDLKALEFERKKSYDETVKFLREKEEKKRVEAEIKEMLKDVY